MEGIQGFSVNTQHRGLDTVLVQKSELLKRLVENKAKHVDIFNEAVIGYKQKIAEELAKLKTSVEEAQVKVASGDFEKKDVSFPMFLIPEPESHEKEYTRAITMLELSVDDQILLEVAEFNQFVMDEWHWKRQFVNQNAAYSQTASFLSKSI